MDRDTHTHTHRQNKLSSKKLVPPYIEERSFLELVHTQLAVDRGMDVDCCSLNLHGARGALLKL
jgi:hypothetical protein